MKSFAVSFSIADIVLLLNINGQAGKNTYAIFITNFHPLLSWQVNFCDRLRSLY